MKFTNNSILSRHYLNYLETLDLNGQLMSQNLSDTEIQTLYNKEYKLTEFDIYKYIVALEHITESLGCDKYNLTEGIIKDKFKYNNILIDLFYHNIPQNLLNTYPIAVVFSIKQVGQQIKDLTKADVHNHRVHFDHEAPACDAMNYFYDELQIYKSFFANYAGNSYTYYIFKQFTKLLLTEVYLYKCKTYIFTLKELLIHFHTVLMNHPEPSTLKPISEWIETGEIEKVKYQCIKFLEPSDINYFPISHLKLLLIDVNKLTTFEESYNTLIQKSFGSFWDYDQEVLNKQFIRKLESSKKNIRID